MRAILLAMLLVLPVAAHAQEAIDPNRMPPSLDPARTANGLAMTPPMGWNSWNRFGCNVTEKIVRDAADAMAASGMRDAGYVYVVIDDCWHGKRDADGFIQASPEKFPGGMKALADYVHAKGLKFGIYSDAGTKTCGGHPGSRATNIRTRSNMRAGESTISSTTGARPARATPRRPMRRWPTRSGPPAGRSC
jgi:alpha-galactosidase